MTIPNTLGPSIRCLECETGGHYGILQHVPWAHLELPLQAFMCARCHRYQEFGVLTAGVVDRAPIGTIFRPTFNYVELPPQSSSKCWGEFNGTEVQRDDEVVADIFGPEARWYTDLHAVVQAVSQGYTVVKARAHDRGPDGARYWVAERPSEAKTTEEESHEDYVQRRITECVRQVIAEAPDDCHGYDLEDWLTQPNMDTRGRYVDPGMCEAHAYLQGMADMSGSTILELADQAGIDTSDLDSLLRKDTAIA